MHLIPVVWLLYLAALWYKKSTSLPKLNSDLLATYLFNDLSKTFTNVLQIAKFCKNHKKFLNARAGQTAGRMHIFILLFTDFQ